MSLEIQRCLSNIGLLQWSEKDSGDPAAGQEEEMEGKGLDGKTFVEIHAVGLNC